MNGGSAGMAESVNVGTWSELKNALLNSVDGTKILLDKNIVAEGETSAEKVASVYGNGVTLSGVSSVKVLSADGQIKDPFIFIPCANNSIVLENLTIAGADRQCETEYLGGAVYAGKDITLAALKGSVEFAASSDTLYSEQRGITVTAENLDARAAGGSFSAPQGTIKLEEGMNLKVRGVQGASSLSDLFAMEAASLNFSGVKLSSLSNGQDFPAVSGDLGTARNYGFDLSDYCRAGVTSSPLGSTGWQKLTLDSAAIDLTWRLSPALSGVWKTGSDDVASFWVDEQGRDEYFYIGDRVSFATTGEMRNIEVRGEVNPGSMDVSGNFFFDGGKITVAGDLNISGKTVFENIVAAESVTMAGDAEFHDVLTANRVVLAANGRGSFYAPVAVNGGFTAKTGSTLVVNRLARDRVMLAGADGATLKIESDAELYVEGASVGTYKIYEGFSVVDGEWNVTLDGADLASSWENGDLLVTVARSDKPDVPNSGSGTALNVVNALGGALNGRMASINVRGTGEQGRFLGQGNFLPAPDLNRARLRPSGPP